MLSYYDMTVKECVKVMREDQHEVRGCEWMVMHEQQEVMKEWIWEDEKMKEYLADDGQVE